MACSKSIVNNNNNNNNNNNPFTKNNKFRTITGFMESMKKKQW